MKPEPILNPPENPRGGKTLVVDAADPASYPRPSAALEEAGPDDQVFVRPGAYEDKIFVADRPIRLVGAGADVVQIINRRGGPLYLQKVTEGLISGITFRYVGSDQYSPMNLLDSTCLITACRVTEGILSGIVIYGPESRPTVTHCEVCHNRESGIFIFAGARPYIRENLCHGNHHFGLAVRDHETRPDLVRNICRNNRLSGILMFHFAQAMVLENDCHDNDGWGMVVMPDCKTTPPLSEIKTANQLDQNPRGALLVTEAPLADIGR